MSGEGIATPSMPEPCADALDPEMPSLLPCDEVNDDNGIGGVWATIGSETVLLKDFEGFEECYHLGKQLNCQGVVAVRSGSVTPMMHASFISCVCAKALELFPLLNLYIPIGAASLKTS
jgi:hypothetical protein